MRFPMPAIAIVLAATSPVPLSAQVATDRPTSEIPLLAQGEGRHVAERLAAALETSFTDLPTGARYASKLRARAAAGAYDRGNWRDLTEWINADLMAINPDRHLRLFATVSSGDTGFESPGEDDSHDAQVDSQRWIAPGIAYVRFHGFPGWNESRLATDNFLRDYSGAHAIIFDMRDNSGGGLSEMDRIFSALFAKPTRLVTMQINRSVEERDGVMVLSDRQTLRSVPGPANLILREHWALPRPDGPDLTKVRVYVLTGRQTMSAAEHFALSLKRTYRATLVGQPTHGANHFGGEVRLTDHFAAFVPVGRTFDPDTGRDWEGSGVAPDVLVPEDRALDRALRIERERAKHPRH